MFAAHIATVSIPIRVFHNLSSATLIKNHRCWRLLARERSPLLPDRRNLLMIYYYFWVWWIVLCRVGCLFNFLLWSAPVIIVGVTILVANGVVSYPGAAIAAAVPAVVVGVLLVSSLVGLKLEPNFLLSILRFAIFLSGNINISSFPDSAVTIQLDTRMVTRKRWRMLL